MIYRGIGAAREAVGGTQMISMSESDVHGPIEKVGRKRRDRGRLRTHEHEGI